MKYILVAFLFFLSGQVKADQAKFYGDKAVEPDPVQQELVAASIYALLQDCSVAIKIDRREVKLHSRRLEVTYSRPVEFTIPPAGKVNGIHKVIVSLWNNAEQTMRMSIYAYSQDDVYSLSKYVHLAYPIINMIKQPMPPLK